MHTVIYNIFEQACLDLLLKDVIDKTLGSYIFTYFNVVLAADKVGGELFSTNSFMALVASFMPRKTEEAISADCKATKM